MCAAEIWSSACLSRVKGSKSQKEQMSSGLAPEPDIQQRGYDFGSGPISDSAVEIYSRLRMDRQLLHHSMSSRQEWSASRIDWTSIPKRDRKL